MKQARATQEKTTADRVSPDKQQTSGDAKTAKHIIWSDVNLNYEDWRADLEANYPDITEEKRITMMREINNSHLDIERKNLDIQLAREIILIADCNMNIADCDLWYDWYMGYKIIDSGNIKDCLYKDCLYADCDYAEWFVDKNGDLRCNAYHRDGTGHYLYREIKRSATDEQILRLQGRICDHLVTEMDIAHVTERLGHHIAKVYGWEIN